MTFHLLELCNMERTQIKDGVDSFTAIRKDNNPRGCFIDPVTHRHSFITNLLRNNVNIVYAKELLGHASIQGMMTYTHIVDGRSSSNSSLETHRDPRFLT